MKSLVSNNRDFSKQKSKSSFKLKCLSQWTKIVFLLASCPTMLVAMEAEECPVINENILLKMLYTKNGELRPFGAGVPQILNDGKVWKLEERGNVLPDSATPGITLITNLHNLKFSEVVGRSTALSNMVTRIEHINFEKDNPVLIQSRSIGPSFELIYQTPALNLSKFNVLYRRSKAPGISQAEREKLLEKAIHVGLPSSTFKFTLNPATPLENIEARRIKEEQDNAERQRQEEIVARRAAHLAREAEQQRQREAAEAARLAAEEQARLVREAEEQRQREAAEAARLAAEEQARLVREAEEQRQRETAEAARLAAEEQARLAREAEEQRQQEAAQAARLAAEEQARLVREAEEQRQREAAEAARLAAEEQARLVREAEEQRQRETAEAARLAAEEQARRALQAQEQPINRLHQPTQIKENIVANGGTWRKI